MTEAKPWQGSRTLWANAAGLVVVAIGLSLDSAGVFAFTAQQIAVLTIVMAVINAWLRLITAQPIAGTPAAKGIPPTGPGQVDLFVFMLLVLVLAGPWVVMWLATRR